MRDKLAAKRVTAKAITPALAVIGLTPVGAWVGIGDECGSVD